jgi:hypothetical protein
MLRRDFTWIFACSIILGIFVAYGEWGFGGTPAILQLLPPCISMHAAKTAGATSLRLLCGATHHPTLTLHVTMPGHLPPPPPQASALMTWRTLSAPLWAPRPLP